MSGPTEETVTRLTEAVERLQPPLWKLLGRNFLGGVATGLGATVGATVVIALLGVILNALGYFAPLTPLVEASRKLLLEARPPGR